VHYKQKLIICCICCSDIWMYP